MVVIYQKVNYIKMEYYTLSNEKYSDINNNEDFDIVFLKSKYEMISVQIFFFRSGKNLGNRSFLFSDLIFDDSSEILEQFLLFFWKFFFLNEFVISKAYYFQL